MPLSLREIRTKIELGEPLELGPDDLRDALGPDVLDYLELSPTASPDEIRDAVESAVFRSLSDTDLDEYIDAILQLGAKDVGPADRAKLKGLLAYYRKKQHPYTSCVRDNTKRFGPEGAARVCATLKDIMTGTTKWRKGGKKKLADDPIDEGRLLETLSFLEGVDLDELERELFNPPPPQDKKKRSGGKTRALDDDPLPVVDVPGVDVLAEGGPYHGTGSPPEGDRFTKEFLEEVAAANRELAGELQAPNKIGHGKEQKLARNSGLLSDDEMPALGWLDGSTARVEKGDDGIHRLLFDLRDVPRQFAVLMRKAFRKRSAEISKLRSQTRLDENGDPKTYTAITGLAWLGAKRPAIRTLRDVVALFADDNVDAVDLLFDDASGPPAVYLARDSELEVVSTRYADSHAPIEEETGGLVVPSSEFATVAAEFAAGKLVEPATWTVLLPGEIVVPFDLAPAFRRALEDCDGDVTVAVTRVSRDLAESRRGVSVPADTSGEMPETNTQSTLTEEQITALAAAFGITEDDASTREAAVRAKLAEVNETSGDDGEGEGEGGSEGGGTPAATTGMSEAELAVLKAKADRGDSVYEERQREKRDEDIRRAQREGRINLADDTKSFWEEQYTELGAEKARTFLFQMPPNPDFVRAYGDDDDPSDPAASEMGEEAAYRSYCEQVGELNYDALPSVAAKKAAV